MTAPVTSSSSDPTAVEAYQRLLRQVRTNAPHAARAHPLNTDGNGYDELTLGTPLLPQVETGVQEVDRAIDLANRQVSGAFQLANDSAYNVLGAASKGAICGAIVGGLVALMRFTVPYLFSGKPWPAVSIFGILTVLGGVTGGVVGGLKALIESARNIGQLAKVKRQQLFH